MQISWRFSVISRQDFRHSEENGVFSGVFNHFYAKKYALVVTLVVTLAVTLAVTLVVTLVVTNGITKRLPAKAARYITNQVFQSGRKRLKCRRSEGSERISEECGCASFRHLVLSFRNALFWPVYGHVRTT